MRVLVACEYSGRVRDAFRMMGHEAWSCDLRPADSAPEWHIQGDAVEAAYGQHWDLMIAHPYCTFNCLSGIRWMYHPEDTALPAEQRRRHPAYPNRMVDFLEGVEFFKALRDAPIERIALENSQPHGLAMKHLGRYDQILQPWHVGSPVTKGAALWLKNLPTIRHTHARADYEEIHAACHAMAPGPEREKERSRTDTAIAAAFATQWGFL